MNVQREIYENKLLRNFWPYETTNVLFSSKFTQKLILSQSHKGKLLVVPTYALINIKHARSRPQLKSKKSD